MRMKAEVHEAWRFMVNEELVKAWLTYPESQRYAGLGRTTLWTLISSGKIKAARVGRSVRISRRSLDAFMETHATQPRQPGFDDID